jgi:hypothetical protein
MVLKVRSLWSIGFGPRRSSMLFLWGLLMIVGFAADGVIASDAAKTVGPNACSECHKEESAAWQESHHFKTFREMPRNPKGKEIGDKMGVKRVNSAGLCLTCHYTVDSKEKPVAGISCESCHGAGRDWVKVHSEYSGKTEKTETKEEAAARLKLADSKGMIRPDSLYELAKNCYSCHVVPQEDLVNKGGHKAGSDFELVSWSQGEVRHTTWSTKGKENTPANANRKRMLYLVGLGVELETGIRSISKATAAQPYAFDMAKRVDRARKQLAAAAKAVPSVPEIGKLVEYAYSAGLKLNNESYLTAAAEGVSKTIIGITAKYDGSTMAGLDSLIPGPDKFKGAARKPGGGS